MKPLLRAVLVFDALLLLAAGLLLVLTPWAALYGVLQLVPVQPAVAAQAFGVALLGLAWLASHAAIDGRLTSGVARAVGHVGWVSGVLIAVWLFGLHTPGVSALGQLAAVATAAVLVVFGLGSVRLASAVSRRDRVLAAEARTAAKTAAARPASAPVPPVVVPPQPVAPEPVVSHPATAPSASATRVEPTVGTLGGAAGSHAAPAAGQPGERERTPARQQRPFQD